MQGLPAAIRQVLWLLVSFPLGWPIRRVRLVVVLLVTWAYFTLVHGRRHGGHVGDDQLALDADVGEVSRRARTDRRQDNADATPLKLEPGDWPGFAGRIATTASPASKFGPTGAAEAVWTKDRPRMGFIRRGRQAPIHAKQWDQNEAVVCYDGDNGKILWF